MMVEGITLTPAMIDNIKWFQENPGIMDTHLKTFDKSIALIAKEYDSLKPEEAVESLKQIADLCYIKGIYQTLEGKE